MAISNASNQIVKVNLIPGIIPSVLHLSQYDTGAGRPITFSVYDGSQAFTIPSGVSIAFEGTKPDGKGFSFTCTRSGSNALLTNYTNQMTALPGKIMCQLVFTDTSGGRVGSLPVLMVVAPAGINGDTVISDSDIEAIIAAQNQYAVLNARLDTAISAATQDSEVQDIRVKADGTSAATAGNAVREQFTELKNNLDVVGAYERSNNLLDVTKIVVGLLNTSGKVATNANWRTTEFIPVSGEQTLMFQAKSSSISTTRDTVYFTLYDANRAIIGSRNSFNINRGDVSGTFQSTSGTAYIRLSYILADYTDVMIHIGGDYVDYEPYYVLKSDIASSETVSVISEKVDDAAMLPETYAPIEITLENGVIHKDGTVYFPSETYAGRYTTIPVSAGEIYSISGYSLNDNYPCAYVKAANNLQTILLTGTTLAFIDEIVTIPENAATLYVNGDINYQLPVIKVPSRITQEEFDAAFANIGDISSVQNPLKCIYKNNVLYIKKKYDSTKDLCVTFGNVGGNRLFNFRSAFLVANTGDAPSNDFTDATALVTWSMSGSDWLGPYIVEAVNNADGDTPQNEYFTGGNHRTTNTSSGGAITATQQGLTILINGFIPVEDNVIYSCDNVVVDWNNNVQAYNTTKSDGSGRSVLNESWHMAVTKDKISLHNAIKALEDIRIHKYYGLQATNISGKQYRYICGADRSSLTGGTDTGNSGNNKCRDLEIWNTDFDVMISIEPRDLGLFDHNGGYSFIATSSKLYGYLIGGDVMDVSSGEYLDLFGSYTFK